MMIYPEGHPVRWSTDHCRPRDGAQTGILAREWERFVKLPWVIWDGTTTAKEELGECVEPVVVQEDTQAKEPVTWDTYRKVVSR